jgi:hypothetical protein
LRRCGLILEPAGGYWLQECECKGKNKNRGKPDQKFFGIVIEHGLASAEVGVIDL